MTAQSKQYAKERIANLPVMLSGECFMYGEDIRELDLSHDDLLKIIKWWANTYKAEREHVMRLEGLR